MARGYDKIKRDFTPKRRKRVVEVEDVKVEESSFLTSVFPVIIILAVLLVIGAFYYLFLDYEEAFIIDNNGFFINNNKNLILGTKKNKKTDNTLEITNVEENDIVYKNRLDNYFVNEKKNRINIFYPLFSNDGLSLINYNDEINLIDVDFDRSSSYSQMMISYGNIYNTDGYSRIDNNDYLLLVYPDNVMMNLFDLKVNTTANEYIIPVNSFVYFETDKISYYEKKNDTFIYKEIDDVDYNSIITFSYEGADKKYEYTYEDFLRGIKTVYIAPYKPTGENITPDKPKEEKKAKPKKNSKPSEGGNTGVLVWQKPSVNLSNLSPNVFSVKANLEINDPASVIVKAPTFTIYRNNKTYMKRSYYASGEIIMSGLTASTTFTVVGQYTYLAEDLENNIIVTFYQNTFTTKSLSELSAIDLKFKNGKIYPRKIEVDKLRVTSDLDAEALRGVSRASINIDGKNYFLTNSQINSIINGTETDVSTSESLESARKYNYQINFYDKEGNSLKTTNSKGQTRTSKNIPTVNMRIIKSDIDQVTVGVTTKNPDNVELNNFRYVVRNSSGRIIKENSVSNQIVITDLDPDQLFNIRIYADIDIDDGQGVVRNYEFASMDFVSKPITSLGYINLKMSLSDVTYSSARIDYYINSRTDEKLVRLLYGLRFDIYDENKENLIKSVSLTTNEMERLKNKEELTTLFENLDSNTKYAVVVKTILKQGSTTYELDTTQELSDFITNKKPVKVNLTDAFTTETMIDFDVQIIDEDGAILSDYVRLELRDKNNKVKDSRTIEVNSSDKIRVTYNNLNTNEFYNLYFYADEYNETRKNSTHKYKYMFKQLSIYTETGISGKIELRSSLRVANGTNVADVKSEIKWVEVTDYYTVPKKVDEDGHLHIYSKNGSSNYAYDLSDYHGEIVTVSFSIKAVKNDFDYSVYFSNYYTGTTNALYTQKLEGITDSEWKTFSFTYRVGSYGRFTSFGNNVNKYYEAVHSKWFGKNYTDFAGFYINGGKAQLTEFEIKDFDVHIAYDKEEYVDPNYPTYTIEQGRYNGKTKQDSTFYVRMTDKIFLKGGNKYTFLFDNDTNYKMYIYVSDANDVYQTGYGWNYSEYTFEPVDDKYVRVWFEFKDGNGVISPEDIKNFRIVTYKKNSISPTPNFSYDLVTKVKVNLKDKKDEIPDDSYYIRVLNNGVEERQYKFADLTDTNTITNIIKEIELDENKQYVIELGIKIRDRYYALNDFELSTDDEVLGIESTDDWAIIEPYGRYIVLNDLDFQNYTDQRLGWGNRYFYGTIDFQGYTAHLATAKTDGSSNTKYVRMYRIENSAVIKNAVFDIDINNQSLNDSIYGFVEYNYGTFENIVLNIKDTHNRDMPQVFYGLLTYYNGVNGKIKNFVIKLDGNLYLYNSSGILTRENYGTIENGYIYGDNVVMLPAITSINDNREAGILSRYGGVKSKINRVFSLISFEFSNPNSYAGQFAGNYTVGKIINSYIYGDTNPLVPDKGPFGINSSGTTEYTNTYYMSKNIYTQTGVEQIKASVVSLLDKDFQRSLLGDSFNIDDMIKLGFYPQVKYSTNKMPEQDYIPLPEINIDEYADIIDMVPIETYNNHARIDVSVNNPLGEEISEIVISDLTTNIVSQTYSSGKSNVIIEVSEPVVFVSKYQVRSITSRSANGYNSTRKYSAGDKYLFIDFYKEINNINEFLSINNSLNQNYILMKDLDFTGYQDFYIGNFSGKFNGNNHKIKNVIMTKNDKQGIFNQMNGKMENVYFENIYISRSSSYYGIVGYSNSAGSYNNVHIKNMVVEIPENVTRENMYIGSLVGYANGASISYCSATNITITSQSQAAGITVGGLVGYANQLMANNSYVQNVNISITKAISTNGIGGFVGREGNSNGAVIENCYTTGKVFSNLANTGGIAGVSNAYINNSYSSVDVTSDMSFIAGIAGSGYLSNSNITNSLYLGNVYTASQDVNMHRILGNYESSNTNYAMKESLINGTASTETNGETLLEYDDYLDPETYENILGKDAFDYSKSSQGILPKLYDESGENLLPNQEDNYLFINLFNVDRILIDKHATDADVILYLDNKYNYEITSLKVENAEVEITRNVIDNGKSIIYFTLTPTKYYDTYRLSELTYIDGNGEEQSLERNIRIDATFYKRLRNFDDWQNISTYEAENYILEADIDFAGKTNINTGVMFNKLETADESITYELKNIDLTYTKNANYISLIQKVSTSMKNITFNGINIKNTSTGNNNYNNIILYTYGTLSNVSFKNIEIDAKYKNYVGVVGRNYANNVKDITLDNVTVSGRQYVGSFIASVQSNANDDFDNINASNINVTATYPYAGGLFGHFTSNINYQDKPIYNHIYIKDSDVTSSSYYVGGVSGYGDCNYCIVDNVHVKGTYYVGGAVGYEGGPHQYYKTVKNSVIEGTDHYIGGVYGYSYLTYNDYLINSTVRGIGINTYAVGGISGYKSNWSYTYRGGVIDSTITNEGDRTGGLVGFHYYTSNTGYIYGSFVNNSTIIGNTKVGGLVGTATKATLLAYCKISNSSVIATDRYAGGAVGYFDNNNDYGAHSEGQLNQVNIENVDVEANSYAGGIFGGSAEDPYYANRVRRIYFAGNVNALDNRTYGIASGDNHNVGLINQPRIYFYKESTVNNQVIKDVVSTAQVTDNDLLLRTAFHPGFVTNGVPKYDESEIRGKYSEYIKLEAGKTYQLDVDYISLSNTYTIYLYTAEKVYVNTINNTAVEEYIEKAVSTSYNTQVRFRVYKDCYIIIAITRADQVNSMTLKEVNVLSTSIDSSKLLSTSNLKERLTWVSSIGDTSALNSTKLDYSTSYWILDPLNSKLNSISVDDLSGNNYVASGRVNSITSNGAMFDGSGEANSSLKVANYKLSTGGHITISTRVRNDVSRSYQTIFSSHNGSQGMGVFLHALQVYVLINNSTYATGYYVPMNTEVDITVVYDTQPNNKKFLTVYVNGNQVYQHQNATTLAVNDNQETFIGYDRKYAPQNTSYRYVGLIKNVVVFNRSLSEEEIQDNLNSSSITNSEDLSLYFDFTSNTPVYESYYPKVKYSEIPYAWDYDEEDELNKIDKQELIPLPVEIPGVNNTGLSRRKLNSSTNSLLFLNSEIENNYVVYSSSINTINLEFKEITKDLKIVYEYKDKTYTTNVDRKVYSFDYDYTNEAKIIIKNAYESKEIIIKPEDYAKKIMIKNNKYYYIIDDILYENGKQLINDAKHIYNNLVILGSGKIYNINNNDTQKPLNNEGILGSAVALSTGIFENKIINTYYYYTLIDNDEIDYQLFIYNNQLYMLDNSDTINNNVVFGKYNLEDYEIILTKDNNLKSLKGSIKYPNTFVNAKISEITFDKDSSDNVIMIRYDNGDILSFNYITGEELYNVSNTMKLSIFEYLNSSFSRNTRDLTETNVEYENSKKLIKSIDLNNDNTINEIVNELVDENNNTSNKLNSEYITVYNTVSHSYDVYNVNELIKVDSVKPGEEGNNTEENIDVNKESTNKENKIVSINNKFKSNIELYNHFYDNKSNKVSDKKTIIYSIILILVVLNLLVLSVVYNKKEIKNVQES